MTAATGALRHDLSPETAADVLRLQIQPANYRLPVHELGWTHHAFEHRHAATIASALLEPRSPR